MEERQTRRLIIDYTAGPEFSLLRLRTLVALTLNLSNIDTKILNKIITDKYDVNSFYNNEII